MHVQSVQLRVSLTGRYANALYKEAFSTKSFEVILNNIDDFKKLVESNHELEQILKSRLLHGNRAILIIEEIGKLMNFSELFVDFLKLILTNRRGAFLQNIFQDFLALVDIKTNTLPIRVEVAKTNKNHLVAIENILKKMHPDQSHRFEHYQNSDLLGGFRAFIHERCLDYSLKSRLNRLSYQLKEA